MDAGLEEDDSRGQGNRLERMKGEGYGEVLVLGQGLQAFVGVGVRSGGIRKVAEPDLTRKE